jgi:hypothetical protein
VLGARLAYFCFVDFSVIDVLSCHLMTDGFFLSNLNISCFAELEMDVVTFRNMHEQSRRQDLDIYSPGKTRLRTAFVALLITTNPL